MQLKKLVLLMSCAGIFNAALAADEHTMVVTASGFSQSITNAPASITVISREQLENKPLNNLIDAVKDVQGISVIGSAGKPDISIRGLGAQYTLILVDGQRQNTRASRPNGSGGFESGFIPPVAAIDHIEIIRGPMSSLYGSEAMGGVINIITRPITDKFTGAIALGGVLQENHLSGNSSNGNFWLSLPLIKEKLGFSIYGNSNLRQEDDILFANTGYKNDNIVAKLAISPVKNHSILIEAGRTLQERKITPGKSLKEFTMRGAIKQPNKKQTTHNNRNHWSVSWNGNFNDALYANSSIYQEQAKRITKSGSLNKVSGGWDEQYDSRAPEIKNTVFDLKFTLPLSNNMLTFGSQYQYSVLHDDSTTGRRKSLPAEIDAWQYALFLEDEYSITDNLQATAGVRFDKHKYYASHWNPRGYLVWHINEEFTLKGGAGTAFRTPELRELSPGYATATQGGASIMYGKPNLKPETSVNEEITLAYSNENNVNASITLFNTDFKDKLTNYSLETPDPKTGLNLFTYDNVGKANIKGIEVATDFPVITDSVTASLNYTWLDSKRQSDDEKLPSGLSLKGYPLEMTPEHSANAKLNWQVIDPLTLYLRASYTGKQVWAAQRNGSSVPRYKNPLTTVDLGATWRINKLAKINFAVLNIANQTGEDINEKNGNWVMDDGRRYWANVNIEF